MIKLTQQHYKILSSYTDKIQTSIKNKTVWGYTKEELTELQRIYHQSGGSASHNIKGCSSCAFIIFGQLLKAHNAYVDTPDTETEDKPVDKAEANKETEDTSNSNSDNLTNAKKKTATKSTKTTTTKRKTPVKRKTTTKKK